MVRREEQDVEEGGNQKEHHEGELD
jgi:hypothetical protein